MEEALRLILGLDLKPETRLVYMCLAEEGYLCSRANKKPKRDRVERKALSIIDICKRISLDRGTVIESLNELMEEGYINIVVLDKEQEKIYADMYPRNSKMITAFHDTSRVM